MSALVTNNASATLAAGITSGATSLSVTGGQGAKFPNPGAGQYFYATLVDASNNLEIVKCTSRATDVLTVVRGQEGTTARAYLSGDRLELRPTAALFNEKVSNDGTALIAGRVPSVNSAGGLQDSASLTFAGSTLTVGAAGALGGVALAGSTSGTTTLQPAAIAGGTLTLPATSDTLVGRATTDTLTNKTLTAPVIATISNTGTLTLPTATDTLVGRATTDTLTNKTLNTPVLNGSGGTLTLPAGPDTLVGRATTDTLTNKTFDATSVVATAAANDNSTKLASTAYVDRMWTTGDVKMTLKTAADTGWVLMNDGTIGDASSGATTRANADTSALFTLLWNSTSNADCPVSSGRGGSAAADFAAHKTIALPKALGRALATYGAGSGLTARTLGQNLGEEAHTLTMAEIPNATGAIATLLNSTSGSGVFSTGGLAGVGGSDSGGGGNRTINFSLGGGGGAHNIMQPTVFLNIMVKL